MQHFFNIFKSQNSENIKVQQEVFLKIRQLHAGANPLENIRKILSFLTIMNSNFLIKINLDWF